MDTKQEAKFHEEIQNMEYEPLDPVEMKLIHWSWGLGVALLVVLYIVSRYIGH
ncbi:MAG: bacteriocin-type signal sequence [Desulfovibrionaceae bacterium]|nr:bacteriocin-type signal sequence [Desulfovibrionaceae bacterium]